MSTQFVFIYDYHLAKNVINNICCTKFKRYKKATLEDVVVTYRGNFTQGFIHVERGGKDRVNGVIFQIQDKDIDRIQEYMELQYKVRRVRVNVNTGNRNESVMMFVPDENMRFMIPDIKYYRYLRLAYVEAGFSLDILDKALKRTIKQIYHKIQKEVQRYG